jgi:hypothetical protein
MKKWTTLTAIAVLGWTSLQALEALELPVYVFKDAKQKDNKFIPSGWMGDYSAIRMDENCTDNPKEGKNCLKFTYTGKPTQGANWAGVYFQSKPNDWGTDETAGYDITGAKKLRFFARGDKGGEIVEFKMGGINGPVTSDSDGASTGLITLSKDWQQYEIDTSALDLSFIIGGFCWVARGEDNPEGLTIYLDEVAYVQ